MNYLLHLLVYFNIYVIVALSLNLIVGYAGQLTLAHAGYYAVGGYTYAILSLNFGWGFLPAALAAGLLAAILSLAVSLCSWRLRGDFFVLASLAVQALIHSALYNWSDADSPLGSWSNLTNGPFGIPGIARPHFFGMAVASPIGMALFSSALAGCCALIVYGLCRSPWGRVLVAMRDDELAARGLGKNTRSLKVQVFAIASALVAVAGALYASHVRYLDASSASLDESILMISMVIVGGVGNFRGPIIGAAILITLPEALRLVSLPDMQAANIRLMVYGCLLVGMMLYRPQGIAGQYRLQ